MKEMCQITLRAWNACTCLFSFFWLLGQTYNWESYLRKDTLQTDDVHTARQAAASEKTLAAMKRLFDYVSTCPTTALSTAPATWFSSLSNAGSKRRTKCSLHHDKTLVSHRHRQIFVEMGWTSLPLQSKKTTINPGEIEQRIKPNYELLSNYYNHI